MINLGIRAPLVLSQDQESISDNARALVDKESPVSRFRNLRDAGQTTDTELWSKLSELGWPAMSIAEEYGGLGMSLAESCILMEALGRNLALTPLLSTILAGGLDPDGGAAQGRVVSLAWREAGFDRGQLTTKTQVQAGRLTGLKLHVLDATAADSFVVTAKEGDKPALFRVAAADAKISPMRRIDNRDCAQVHFDNAPATRLVATLEDLHSAMNNATIALAAQMLGGMQAAFELTLAYLKERVQFDVPIGSFQALQHRAVNAYIAIEGTRSAVLAAAREPSPLLASLAKARANDAYLLVANEGVQLFGGIGMTDEHDIGLYLKRARAAGETLGNSAYHRDRWGRLRGY